MGIQKDKLKKIYCSHIMSPSSGCLAQSILQAASHQHLNAAKDNKHYN